MALVVFAAACLVTAVDNPRTSAIVQGIYATGVAVSVLLIAARSQPFTGEISVGPGPLLQLLSEGKG